MVGFVPHSFSRVEACLACGSRGHSQIANADIDPGDFGELFTGWRLYVNGEGNKQIERLLLPVIPEFRVPDGGSGSDEGDMLVIALVGDADAPVEGPDADLLMALKGVIPLIGILHRRGTVLGRPVQALKAFFGDLGPTMLHILFEPGPQSLVGSRHLSLDTTSQLR